MCRGRGAPWGPGGTSSFLLVFCMSKTNFLKISLNSVLTFSQGKIMKYCRSFLGKSPKIGLVAKKLMITYRGEGVRPKSNQDYIFNPSLVDVHFTFQEETVRITQATAYHLRLQKEHKTWTRCQHSRKFWIHSNIKMNKTEINTPEPSTQSQGTRILQVWPLLDHHKWILET